MTRRTEGRIASTVNSLVRSSFKSLIHVAQKNTHLTDQVRAAYFYNRGVVWKIRASAIAPPLFLPRTGVEKFALALVVLQVLGFGKRVFLSVDHGPIRS